MKKLIAMLLVLMMVLAAAACSDTSKQEIAEAAQQVGEAASSVAGDALQAAEDAMKIDNLARLIMVTGGDSGTYYAFGGVIASVLTEKVENLEITATTSGASAANCRSLNTGEADLAILQNDVLDYAYNGTEIMKDDGKMEGLRAIATMYTETIQLVALKSSNINSVPDLKGKKVCVGAQGSGSEANAIQILSAYGLTYDDINVQYLSFSEASNAMQQGTVDAAFQTSGLPNTAVLELSKMKDIVVVPIEGAERDALIEQYPFYVKSVIPAGTYTDAEAESVAILATLACTKDLDNKIVYQITKNLFEQKDALAMGHAKGKDLDVNKGRDGVSIPFHEGALLYYAEAGLTGK